MTKWGYIDQTGKYAIPPIAGLDRASDFSGGLAELTFHVSVDPFAPTPVEHVQPSPPPSAWIDKLGKYVWQPSK